MPKQITFLTVFLSCSGEMARDKELVDRTISEVNKLLISSGFAVQFDLWEWQHDALGGVGTNCQNVIDEQIPEHDVYLGLMWKKFGIPTDKYGSGTEHEFRNSLESHRLTGSPKNILFFFKTSIDSLSDIDANELVKVTVFKQSLGPLGVLYHDYASEDEIQKYLRLHLITFARGYQEGQELPISQSQSNAHLSVAEANPCRIPGNQDADDINLEVDESRGYLDYIEAFQESMSRATELSSALTSSIAHLGSSAVSRTAEMNEALETHGKGKVPIQLIRQLTDLVADDMISFMSLAVPIVDEIENHFNDGFDGLIEFLEQDVTKGASAEHTSEIAGLISGMTELRRSIDESEVGMRSLEGGASTLSHVSSKVKKGVRSIRAFVARYALMCNSARSRIDNIQGLMTQFLSSPVTTIDV